MDFKLTMWEPWDIAGKFLNKRLVVIAAFNDRKKVALLHGILDVTEMLNWQSDLDKV